MYAICYQDDKSSGEIRVIGGDSLENLSGKVCVVLCECVHCGSYLDSG